MSDYPEIVMTLLLAKNSLSLNFSEGEKLITVPYNQAEKEL